MWWRARAAAYREMGRVLTSYNYKKVEGGASGDGA